MAMSRSFGGRSLTTRSPMAISPEVISSRPATIRSVVVLPHPDGPTKTMNSLSRMVRFTSLTAWTSSYFLLRSFSTTCAMVTSLSRWSFAPAVMPRAARYYHTPSGSPRRLPLSLDRPGEAGHVVLDEERVDQRHRDRAQQRPGHELAPEVDVAADQLGHHADRHRLPLRRGEEDQGVDELVPGQREREDPRGQDARHRDREDDPEHRAEARRAVDARALLQLARDGLEVSHEEPGAERDQERRIGEDQRPRGVAELEVPDDVGERDEQE